MGIAGKLIKALILSLLFLTITISLKAQNLDKVITIDLTLQPLVNVLNEITKKGDIRFSYNPQKIPLSEEVTLRAINKPVKEVLDELLTPLNISYSVTGRHVVLKKVALSQRGEVVRKLHLNQHTISGFIRDSINGEVIIGAGIYDKVSLKGTISNAYGFYSLTLPEGAYTITYTVIGYAPRNILIELGNDRRLDLFMQETSIKMNEVEIVSQPELAVIDHVGGQVHLSSITLKRMAGFAGNTDVIKSLQSIPGIAGFGDGSSFYYVRGGDKDQNLMLIDEAPIFNPAHLFGFFSALAPDAIKDVKAYKGDFPASYGGRLSSVIDIRARDGNLNRLGASGNIGLFTTDLTIEGPIMKEKSSFILSARRSNLNWLTQVNSLSEKSFTIKFYDLNAKLNIKLNDKNRIFLTGFTGKDDFSRLSAATVTTFGLSWNNATGTIRWNHLFNNKLFINTTAIFSEYNYYLYMSREQDDYWTSSIMTRALKSDLSWFIKPGNTYRAGIELSNYQSNPGNVHFTDELTQKAAPRVSPYNSLGLSGYFSNERIIGERITLKTGLRVSSWRNLGPATVYFFDAAYRPFDTIEVQKRSFYSPYINAEPRLNITYKLSGSSSLTAGYSRTAQYLQILSNSTSPFTSLDIWAPAGPNIKPQKADLLTLGYLKSFKKLQFSTEVFYKKLYNQIDYKDHANMLYNPLIEGELRFGDSKSYGLEVLLRKNEGIISGWVGYSYSRVLKTIESINSGKEFPASFDHPNSIFANVLLSVARRLDITAGWVYMTGSPFTSPIGFMQYNGSTVPIYGNKNNDRYPDYHRLDLSMTIKLNDPNKRFTHNIVLSVYNAYGRSNPFSISFNKIMDDRGNIHIPADLSGDLEIIPTKISVAGAIPSINYTFKF